MTRVKKNGLYLNVCIKTPIYTRLEELYMDVGKRRPLQWKDY